MKKIFKRKIRVVMGGLLMGVCLVSAAQAQTTHTLTSGGGDGSWNTPANWSTDTVPNVAGDTAAYSTASTTAAITLDITGNGQVTIGRILKTASGSWAINTGTASGFTMDNTGGVGSTALISNQSGSGTLTINPAITISNTNLNITTTNGGALVIGGSITATTNQTLTTSATASNAHITLNGNIGTSGAGTIAIENTGGIGGTSGTVPVITLAGDLGSQVTSVTQSSANRSTLILSGNNSAFTGGVSVTGGNLRAGSTTALSASNLVTMGGGTFDFASSVTIAGLSGSSGNVLTTGSGARDLTLGGSGTYTYDGTITTTEQSATVRGRTRIEVALTDGGTQILTGGSAYSGGTTVSSGTLLINNTTGSGTGTGEVQVQTGGRFGGTGGASGNVTVGSGGSLLGGAGAASGGLTLSGNLNLNSGSVIQLALGASGSHSSLIRDGSGIWTFDGEQAFLFIDAGVEAGIYENIIMGLAGDPGSLDNWTIQNDGWSGFFSYNGSGGIDLNLAAIPEPSTYVLLLGGLGALFWLRRRRNQQ